MLLFVVATEFHQLRELSGEVERLIGEQRLDRGIDPPTVDGDVLNRGP